MTSSEKNTAFLWSQMKSEPSKTIECIEFLFLYDAVIEIKFRLSEFYFDNGDLEKNDVVHPRLFDGAMGCSYAIQSS